MFYSQMGEDKYLRTFFPDKHDGFYIDIGVWEPELDSVTKHFYDDGWSGINIEPVPEYFDRVAIARERDINLQIAVGEQNETRKFFHMPGTGLGSFSEESINLPHNDNRQKYQIFVTTLTLAMVCLKYVPRNREIDFLKVDVEGWEYQVFRGADFKQSRPKVILAEATVPGTSGEEAIWAPNMDAWDLLLKEAHYEFVNFDGLNRWYVDKGWREANR